MEYKYFNNGEVLHLDFELDSRYDVGTTYEDYLDGAWVPLSKGAGGVLQCPPFRIHR